MHEPGAGISVVHIAAFMCDLRHSVASTLNGMLLVCTASTPAVFGLAGNGGLNGQHGHKTLSACLADCLCSQG